jgi:hypothetical protein
MKTAAKILAGAILVIICHPLRADPQEPQHVVDHALLKARVDAARRTYEALAKNYIESRPPLAELLYRWSCRWLDAERHLSARQSDQVAACQAHLNRMKEVERVTKDRFRNRYVPIEEDSAAQFYRVEAEIWLAEARKN